MAQLTLIVEDCLFSGTEWQVAAYILVRLLSSPISVQCGLCLRASKGLDVYVQDVFEILFFYIRLILYIAVGSFVAL